MSKKKILNGLLMISAVILLLTGFSTGVQAYSQEVDVTIYLFYGEGCPHCEVARPALQEVVAQNPRIGYVEFEVYHDPENIDFFWAFTAYYGTEPQGVPTIFIGERYWIGYSENILAEIEAYLDQCLAEGCPDPGIVIFSEATVGTTEQDPEATPTPEPTSKPTQEPTAVTSPTTAVVATQAGDPNLPPSNSIISLPLIGAIDLSSRSLLLSTLLISFVDGFNPCSIWVLSMLLAITLNTRSRKKVLIIGFVFIFVTGVIYALFIGGLFTVFSFISFVGWIQVIVAIVALVFGLVNIKDYFWYKEGISFTIRDEKKPGIYKGIRRIMNADDSLWGLIGGTIILAAGVSLVEFSCTAGFPMLWTNLLAAHNVSGVAFLGFLLVYMIVYQLDELGIFLVSVFTLRKTKLEEKHGRILKLLGGMLMLSLAIVMLIDPTLMNEITSALLVFGAAFGLTGLILLIHRVILPKFDIQLGSEEKS